MDHRGGYRPPKKHKGKRSQETREQEAASKPVAQAGPGPAQAPEGMLLGTGENWPSLRSLIKQAKAPMVANGFSWREHQGCMFFVFMFALMLYGVTAPREVTLEDDGLFLMNLHHFGVGHPPGYPLYTLLGSPFYFLMPDFLPPAYKGHMFSGFMGAIACVAIYAIVTMLVRSRMCAMAAGIAYAASECFWSQAIIAEVYTLNAALYFILMAMCLGYASHTGPPTRRHLILYLVIAFTYGLALSNHWPLIGLGSISLLLIVLSQTESIVKRAPLGLLCLALGLLPYAWLYVRSNMESVPINFYGPIEPDRLWFYVSRSGYSGVDKQAGVGLEEKLVFTQFFLVQLTRQYTLLGLAVALVGFVAMLRSAVHGWLAVLLALAWFMTGPLLILLVDFQTEFIWFSAFRVYHLLCYGITAILFAYGLAWLGDWFLRRRKTRLGAHAVVATLAVLVVAIGVPLNWDQNNRREYTWARDLAMFKLLDIDPNARLFTYDDLDLPVGYLNMVERVRPDVLVYNDQALVFGERLYTPFTPDTTKTRIINSYVKQTDPLPIYYHPNRTELYKVPNVGNDFLGFWRRLNRENADNRIIMPESLRHWLVNNLNTTKAIKDRWTKQQASGVIATLVSALHSARRKGHRFEQEWNDVIDLAYENNELVHFYLLWHMIFDNTLNRQGSQEEVAWIDSMLATKDTQVFDNSNWADMLLIKAQIFAGYPDLIEEGSVDDYYESLLRQALDIEFKYSVYKTLADYYRSVGRQSDALALLDDRHPTISKAPLEFRQMYDLLTREVQQGRLLQPVRLGW